MRAETNSRTQSRERAFVLRCWFEDESTGWRFILEPIGQDWERAGFANLLELLSFLEWNLECGLGDDEFAQPHRSSPVKE